MLSDGDDARLMVGRGIDGRQFIDAGLKALVNSRGQFAILCGCVQALEESEFPGVRGLRLVKLVQLLNHDMGMSFDLALPIKLLWCGKVVRLCIDEEPCLHVFNRHLHRKCLPSFDSTKVLRKDELRRGHVVHRGDHTNGRRIARTLCNLLSIGDREVRNGQAEIDKVVR